MALRVRRMLIADEEGREEQFTAIVFHVISFRFRSGEGCLVGSLDGEMTN